jgi:hypothetical protein
MIEPRPSVVKIASAHVRAELVRQPGLEAVAVPLHDCLARLVGTGGFEILLSRALVLAKTEHPVLADVTATKGGLLVGLGKPEHDAVAAEQAAVAVVAQLLELLVVLVGEELTMQLLHGVLAEPSDGAPRKPPQSPLPVKEGKS